MWLGVTIFGVTYLAMAGGPIPWLRADRPTAALCGAVAMVIAGVISLDEAWAAVDLGVITLLLGVMIIGSYLQRAQFFRYCAWLVLTRARSPIALLWSLVFVAGALSALLLNDTICLMFTPLTIAVVTEAELPALPYLIALASATNIGGVMTFTGNPQNMVIGHAAAGDPSYVGYLAQALPVGILCLVVNAALITWMFRPQLRAALGERTTPRPRLDGKLTAKALAAVAGFAIAAAAGAPLAGAAIAAASALILVARIPARPTLATVDWPLLLFFAGLFVVVRGLQSSGAIDGAADVLAPAIGAGGAAGDAAFAAFTVVGSNLVSNVPYVLVAVSWVPELPDPPRAYTMLAIASTLAGNLTLFGSVANIIVFETAGAHGKIGFIQFAKYGAVLTLASLLVAFGVLYLVG